MPDLICKTCGNEMYLSDEPPYDSLKLEDLCCSECGGDVEYLIELDPEDLADEHTADE